MTYRVIQWATGGVGRAAIEAHRSTTPSSSWWAVGCTARRSWDRTPARSPDATRSASSRPTTSTRCSRSTPTASSTARSWRRSEARCVRILESGQERGDAARLVLSQERSTPKSSRRRAARGRHAARHRHPPRRDHRALPADGLGALARRHPRARRGILRHPHLRRPPGRRRHHALRQDAGGGAGEPDAALPRRRLPAVDRHGRRHARLRPRRREAQPSTRWRSRRAPIDSPIGTIEPGHVAAQRFTWQGLVRGEPVVTVRMNWFMGEEHLDPAGASARRASASRSRSAAIRPSKLTFHGCTPSRSPPGLKRNPRHRRHRDPLRQRDPGGVRRAEPGIRSYLDLPLVSGRAAPALLRRPA